MTFDNWLDTFVEEKGIDTEYEFQVVGEYTGLNLIPVGCVIEYIKEQNEMNKAAVKDKLVQIDFHNGDVTDFFKYVAQFMADR